MTRDQLRAFFLFIALLLVLPERVRAQPNRLITFLPPLERQTAAQARAFLVPGDNPEDQLWLGTLSISVSWNVGGKWVPLPEASFTGDLGDCSGCKRGTGIGRWVGLPNNPDLPRAVSSFGAFIRGTDTAELYVDLHSESHLFSYDANGKQTDTPIGVRARTTKFPVMSGRPMELDFTFESVAVDGKVYPEEDYKMSIVAVTK